MNTHACVEAGIEKKNFDFDQSLEHEQKPSVEETRRHFSETSFRLCRGWNHSQTPAKRCQFEQFQRYYLRRGETYIQFAARLTANFQYYCSLRKVNSFESLCDLIISDKLFETLNKETATHIGIREVEDWFRPIDLAKECDIYISSRS
ncbi:DUF1758 domain-containing protein [Trichonephila clavipes]|nr:DUF1758 domain-containing protein [Trichonephila clavipes]